MARGHAVVVYCVRSLNHVDAVHCKRHQDVLDKIVGSVGLTSLEAPCLFIGRPWSHLVGRLTNHSDYNSLLWEREVKAGWGWTTKLEEVLLYAGRYFGGQECRFFWGRAECIPHCSHLQLPALPAPTPLPALASITDRLIPRL